VNVDNWSDVRREASRHFRKREYLKDKINEIELNSKNKIRDLTEFKKGYQPKSNMVNDERGDLLVDPQKILTRWKNYFCQLLNVQNRLCPSLVLLRLRLLLET
jgi:hypothetical protein